MVSTISAPIRTDLNRCLRCFESCFPCQNTRNYCRIDPTGLLSNLPRKNGEAIALQANEPGKTERKAKSRLYNFPATLLFVFQKSLVLHTY